MIKYDKTKLNFDNEHYLAVTEDIANFSHNGNCKMYLISRVNWYFTRYAVVML